MERAFPLHSDSRHIPALTCIREPYRDIRILSDLLLDSEITKISFFQHPNERRTHAPTIQLLPFGSTARNCPGTIRLKLLAFVSVRRRDQLTSIQFSHKLPDTDSQSGVSA
jgi:hypothetical protein